MYYIILARLYPQTGAKYDKGDGKATYSNKWSLPGCPLAADNMYKLSFADTIAVE